MSKYDDFLIKFNKELTTAYNQHHTELSSFEILSFTYKQLNRSYWFNVIILIVLPLIAIAGFLFGVIADLSSNSKVSVFISHLILGSFGLLWLILLARFYRSPVEPQYLDRLYLRIDLIKESLSPLRLDINAIRNLLATSEPKETINELLIQKIYFEANNSKNTTTKDLEEKKISNHTRLGLLYLFLNGVLKTNVTDNEYAYLVARMLDISPNFILNSEYQKLNNLIRLITKEKNTNENLKRTHGYIDELINELNSMVKELENRKRIKIPD